MSHVLVGDTIKLTVEFRTFSGVVVDPENITLKIMDSKGQQIGEIIEIISSHKVSPGIYSYEYIVPDKPNELIYEFKGYVNGKPIVGRSRLYSTLVKDE